MAPPLTPPIPLFTSSVVELRDGDCEGEERAHRCLEVEVEVVFVDLPKLRPHVVDGARGDLHRVRVRVGGEEE